MQIGFHHHQWMRKPDLETTVHCLFLPMKQSFSTHHQSILRFYLSQLWSISRGVDVLLYTLVQLFTNSAFCKPHYPSYLYWRTWKLPNNMEIAKPTWCRAMQSLENFAELFVYVILAARRQVIFRRIRLLVTIKLRQTFLIWLFCKPFKSIASSRSTTTKNHV